LQQSVEDIRVGFDPVPGLDKRCDGPVLQISFEREDETTFTTTALGKVPNVKSWSEDHRITFGRMIFGTIRVIMLPLKWNNCSKKRELFVCFRKAPEQSL
jgi:hypothetical protein